MSRSEVNDFCLAAGFNRLWGSMIESEIACQPDPDFCKGIDTPRVVPKKETEIIVNLLKAEIDKGTFTPDTYDGQGNLDQFNKEVLNDFLPQADGTPGHIWEYQLGLKIELEHGRTRGANVTNNHPLLTGIIVMAHLTEDTLYYARLWVMEVEGEIFNKKLNNGTVKELSALNAELTRAKQHLADREAEKVAMKAA
ncbi:hypothetical protein VU07_01935 [Desulfobulbus sp. F4]|nr:hypothetical protein [Desulfobulbus sp. F4]